jgi:hypothetical protein
MKKISYSIFLITLLVIGCSYQRIVNYNEMWYMEVSTEKEGYLIFRAEPQFDKVTPITEFKFSVSHTQQGNKYFLSLIKERDHKGLKRKAQIQTMLDGLIIMIIIPVNQYKSDEPIFYKDSKGEYPITPGTKESWRHFIQKRFNNSVSDDIIL